MTKLQKVNELTAPPIVGKYYLVPCIKVFRWVWIWLPIVGDAHTDAELDVTKKHFHRDVRFLPNDFLFNTRTMDGATAQLGNILGVEENRVAKPIQIEFKRLKCRREMPEFPLLPQTRYTKFHKKYVGKKVLCGKCPHRNMPLESLPQDASGHVICNGHGLKIDMKNAVVVKREFPAMTEGE